MQDMNPAIVLSQLTLDEKVHLTTGLDWWHTLPIDRLGIPSVRLSDGPAGVRGTQFFNSAPALCIPCGTALGATFNTDVLRSVGGLLGREAKRKGAKILLGPTMNIQRSPVGGRGYESFSEDPDLSGMLGGAYCQGVATEGVIATIKHFICNDQENQRMFANSMVTDRALREIYLKPFMLAIKMANPRALMTSYNKVNGIHVSESPALLNILRDDWKWDGLVMSDWYGVYSTTESIIAGVDLEMPGPSRFRGEALLHAINANKVKESILDQRVLTILKTVKYASQEIQPEAPNIAVDGASESDILRRAACESIVLLKNEGSILPLDKTKTVAVIGPNSKITTYSGGGSANLVPSYVISPYEGVQAKSSFEVPWSLGVYAHKDLPLLGHLLKRADQETGFSFKAYDKARGSKTRTILDTLHLVDSNMFLIDYVCPNTTSLLYFIDIEGTFTPEEDGIYDFGLTVHGTGRLFINGELIVDNTSNQLPGVSFFGAGTREEVGSIKLCAGRSYELLVEFATSPTSKLPKQEITSFGPGGIRIGGCKRVNPTDSIQQAVQLASQTDQVIVFAGLNSDWEAESSDRPDISLPPYTDKLISEVLIANPKAVIVLQSGTPVAMPWVGDASAIVHAWYGGNETGNAIADVLFGDFNPCGKLPLTFPIRNQDNPAFHNTYPQHGRVLYGEDVFVGYRHYDTISAPTLFPFGHGLSYTRFEVRGLNIAVIDNMIRIRVSVSNIGLRSGAEVVQVYVKPPVSAVNRPYKELKAFRKVFLDASLEEEVEFELESKYATSYWDEGHDSWAIEKGTYSVLVGTSSQGSFLTESFIIESTSWWTGI